MIQTKRLLMLLLIMTALAPLWGCVAQYKPLSREEEMARTRHRTNPSGMYYVASYDIALVGVERPVSATGRFGDISIRKIQVSHVKIEVSHVVVHQAEDQLVKIQWLPPGRELSFELLNKTDQALKIPWDKAAYVDVTGQSHRVMHSGVKFSDLNAPQPPSIVPSKGRLTDILYPTDSVTFTPGRFGGWGQPPMFPCTRECIKPSHEHLLQVAAAHKGSTYRVLLPFQVGHDIFNYIFTFKVNNVEIVGTKKEEPQKKSPEVAP